jgi:two-component system alkaline phosphatase synthesis response regulator PhoP
MSQGIKIAIIEDDRPIAQMYKLKLESAGFQTVLAYDGKQGLDIAKKHLPQLMLLDLRMPQMNGDEMLEKMRQTDWGSNIRVIILTNISRDEAPRSLSLLNVDRYIVKAHHTPTQVLEIINEILNIS